MMRYITIQQGISMSSYKYFCATENDMLAFSSALSPKIQPGTIIFLQGPLGAGKTTFTRGFLRGLGYQAKVKSPTYTLVEPYSLAHQTIFHFDLYRLQDPRELEHIGIHDYFRPEAICLIEWPEKGFPYLPSADLICTITPNQQGREIQIDALTLRGESVREKL
jgi:tRNA threonylcarbamoyladenosine biosynthesis protein TsaE